MKNDLVKRLYGVIALSGLLNVVFVFLFLQQGTAVGSAVPPKPLRAKKQSVSLSAADLMLHYRRLSFEHLLTKLGQKEPVESGYRERDFALASLIAFYDLDIDRALAQDISRLPRRAVTFSGGELKEVGPFFLYPGLTDAHFAKVKRFAAEEKWPFTAKGLFARLKDDGDITAAKLFLKTPEFLTLKKIIGDKADSATILKMCLEGTWKQLEQVHCNAQKRLNTTDRARRALLDQYIAAHSPTAVEVLLKTDHNYVTRAYNDADLKKMLSLVKGRAPETEALMMEVAMSPRSTTVVKTAQRQLATPASEQTLYVVQQGDTLWKIAHHHGVDVNTLRHSNELASDSLNPGKILVITR